MEGAEVPLSFLRFMLRSHKGNNAAMGPIDAGGDVARYTRKRPMTYKAEYIWIDGTEPTARLRSKTKIITGKAPKTVADLPIWGFDGSSTNQAPGSNSDCVLQPVFVRPDPIRGGDHILVMCEVLLTDMTPHPTNTRAFCGRSPRSSPARSRCSASSRSTRSSRSRTRSGSPRGASRL